MIKEYKITQRNSTLCGYPARGFDWSKLCWDGSEQIEIESRHMWDDCPKGSMGYTVAHSDYKCPLPYEDDFFIGDNSQYLHVPYNWKEHGTIFRVRPNETMWAGEIYRGKKVLSQKAIKKDDGWYWVLEMAE
jgi:hypothetical protein